MPITKGELSVQGQTAGNFNPMPPDVYEFTLIDVAVVEKKKFNSEEKEKRIQFKFACIEEGPYYGSQVWRDVTQKLTKYKGGSNLYLALKGIMGREITDEEVNNAASFLSDELLNGLVGTQVRLSVDQVTSETGKVYNNLVSYLPVKTKLPVYDPEKKPTKATPVGQVAEPSFSDAPAPTTAPAEMPPVV